MLPKSPIQIPVLIKTLGLSLCQTIACQNPKLFLLKEDQFLAEYNRVRYIGVSPSDAGYHMSATPSNDVQREPARSGESNMESTSNKESTSNTKPSVVMRPDKPSATNRRGIAVDDMGTSILRSTNESEYLVDVLRDLTRTVSGLSKNMALLTRQVSRLSYSMHKLPVRDMRRMRRDERLKQHHIRRNPLSAHTMAPSAHPVAASVHPGTPSVDIKKP